MPRVYVKPGEQYNQLSVLYKTDVPGRPRFICLCSCGNYTVVRADSLVSGRTKSCGCLNVGKPLTHGDTHSSTYSTWKHMKSRCTNPNHTHYARYGGRGIRVCERWLVYENFLADMGERPAGLELDRISNELGYEKDNCRWTTHKINTQNRSSADFTRVTQSLTTEQLLSVLSALRRSTDE